VASPTVRARFARGFAGFREGVVRRRAVLVLALVSLAVALIVRLPAILWPVFNWDESTFLAVGRRILQLPYTSTLENKPPLAFVPYALPTLFGIDDLRFARLLAALVVAATGVLLGLIASRRLPVQLATAVVAVVMISVVPGGDAWMTELDVMFWGSLVAYLTSRILRGRPTSFFWFGLCIGAFPLLRTNWALVAVMFGIVGLVAAVRARRWVRFILGGMIPWLIVIGAYVVTGRAGSLVLGAIRIPSSINAGSHGDLSLPEGMARMAAVSAALLVAAVILRIRTAESKLPGILALIGLVLIVVPAFPEYADYDHHTLQIVPFLALGVGMLMDAVALRTVGRRSAWRILAAGVSVV
ncbi:hypothetical protein, partial [Mesorhizobium japonicum]|uniref:hypothetical protein n=1 Tax=Mesorhizobium japonicum TaxID=2066070 RepID=UPI003B5A96E9